jgi:hypothetical protein
MPSFFHVAGRAVKNSRRALLGNRVGNPMRKQRYFRPVMNVFSHFIAHRSKDVIFCEKMNIYAGVGVNWNVTKWVSVCREDRAAGRAWEWPHTPSTREIPKLTAKGSPVNGLLADARNVCVCERVMWTSSSPSLVFIIPRHVPTN